MPNALTRTTGLSLGPIALDTLLKHYFDRIKKERAQDDFSSTQLRQDELLYDEAFNIAKRFFDTAIHHSVEDLQAFSNIRTPSPPWVHVARVTVPLSCCDEAAALLIQVLGGEEQMFHLVGGTKWWQVRGVPGVAGEWMTARKDWEEAKKRRKAAQEKKADGSGASQDAADRIPSSTSDSSNIDGDDDNFRCILYTHGGGYYFGSVDQERYCIQRLARKIKGRVFAINYRLAPQYPFPCALQDLVAAYLYLIKPPPDAPHQPVKPSHIVVAGDSAGGGLTLALLQVLRDSGQPLPAGGVLVSPWSDLTHSFPSIHTNTVTDILPAYGLSIHKPSALWPPPSEEMTRSIHTGLRRKIKQFAHVTRSKAGAATTPELARDASTWSNHSISADGSEAVSSNMPIDVGATAALPSVDGKDDQSITLQTKSGETLKIESQIHLYTQNSLIGHPLISPALSYLGGLPPLLVIASDKEVLRDEVVYSAFKAADPSKFPLKDEARILYPPLVGIESRYGPTPVHLQVYDDTAHVLPVLFPFTTPAKYCYRAMATFTKHVTGMLQPVILTPSSSDVGALAPPFVSSPVNEDLQDATPLRPSTSSGIVTQPPGSLSGSNTIPDVQAPVSDTPHPRRPSLSRHTFLSFQIKTVRASLSRSTSEWPLRRREPGLLHPQESQGVEGPTALRRSVSMIQMTGVRYAGEASVYYNEVGLPSWKKGMICERVSTQGIIRPLEPADTLDAFHVPPAIIGVLSEKAIRRYLEGKTLFDHKYAKEALTIERTRQRNIDLAKKDITRNLTHLQELHSGPGKQKEASQAIRDGLESSTGAWGWAWANERPPPSSIVSRRDTDESRRLAQIADQTVLQEDGHMNSNSLWTIIVNSLTASTPKEHPASDSEAVESPVERGGLTRKSRSVFASLKILERQPKSGD